MTSYRNRLPDMRALEELEHVAKEFRVAEDAMKYDGAIGRKGGGRTISVARGTYFHRMWSMEVAPMLVAAAIGCACRTVRYWYAEFNRSKAA